MSKKVWSTGLYILRFLIDPDMHHILTISESSEPFLETGWGSSIVVCGIAAVPAVSFRGLNVVFISISSAFDLASHIHQLILMCVFLFYLARFHIHRNTATTTHWILRMATVPSTFEIRLLIWINALLDMRGRRTRQVPHVIFAIVIIIIIISTVVAVAAATVVADFHKGISWIAAARAGWRWLVVWLVRADAQTREDLVEKWCHGRQRGDENCKGGL